MSGQKKSLAIAGAIAIAVAAWIMTGDVQVFGRDDSQQHAPETTTHKNDGSQAEEKIASASKAINVETEEIRAQNIQNNIVITGLSQPSQHINITAEINGRLSHLPLEEGEMVKKGDILAKIAVDDRQANVNQAKETIRQRQIEFEAAKELERQGFGSEVRTAQARSALEIARSALTQAEIALGHTVIRAPFEGILDRRDVDLGDVVQPGTVMGHLISLDPIEFEAFVSEFYIMELKKGQLAKVTLTNGEKVDATIEFISRSANTQARTFRVKLSAPNPDNRFIAGMTVSIDLPLDKQSAHFLSPAFLTLNDDGSVGVKIVENGKAVFKKVEIIKSTNEGVYVIGLPDPATIITFGHEFISNGAPITVE